MKGEPRQFHGILMTLDSVDIIEESISHALTWADLLHICDTGSTDGTWDIVSQWARKDPRIRARRWDRVVFHEGVRSLIFNEARKEARPGDWFAKVDEDEFYHVAPPEFVERCCAPHETSVWPMIYEFSLTTADPGSSEDAAVVAEERKRLIRDRLRYYAPLQYSEPRMFRYRTTMSWTPDIAWPWNAGFVARKRIPLRHYPHRDSIQLSRRVEIRRAMLQHLPPGTYPHWKVNSWRDYLVTAGDPGLSYWAPGTDLPACDFQNHLQPGPKRLAQRVAHAALLPVLDRLRPRFDNACNPVALIETHRA